VAWFGAGRSLPEARAPRVVTVKGLRFAFLGTFFLGDRNIEPEAVIATVDRAGVAGHHDSLDAEVAMLTADIRAAKTKADHVIVFAHWGREGTGTPEPYQVALAHAAIEAGASAVIGSHPHVLQGAERWKGRPIFYSLGNFVFGGNWNPKDKRTALAELTFDRDGVRGVRVIPATSDAYPERPVQPALAEGPEAQAILDRVAELSKDLPEPLIPLRKDDGRALPPDGGVERPGR
jgi:poly-gamma-glutamate synthesis protein (capsule biosynthesis protein)